MAGYCPKCKSKIYPLDVDYLAKYGVCSYCVTYKKKENIHEQEIRKDSEKKDEGEDRDNDGCSGDERETS